MTSLLNDVIHTFKPVVQQVMDSCLLCLIFSLVAGVTKCVEDDHRVNGTHHHDYCILGAGPAGLQMGYFLSKAKRDHIILERNSGPGSFFHKSVEKSLSPVVC